MLRAINELTDGVRRMHKSGLKLTETQRIQAGDCRGRRPLLRVNEPDKIKRDKRRGADRDCEIRLMQVKGVGA